jgi:hypothetical protein
MLWIEQQSCLMLHRTRQLYKPGDLGCPEAAHDFTFCAAPAVSAEFPKTGEAKSHLKVLKMRKNRTCRSGDANHALGWHLATQPTRVFARTS